MRLPVIYRWRELLLVLFIALGIAQTSAQPVPPARSVLTIDARTRAAPPETGYLQLGSKQASKSPGGHILSVNSRYLTLDGKPWLPVMGEFHYTRYPERYWEEEILKMKAGGVQIISTYIFWIHHEEVEGQFDWTGQRNLRKFVQLCATHDLYVYPRIGPWAHGEVRNGGHPDWLLKKGPTRVNDPIYLAYVRKYYDQVGRQLKGLLWKEGGRVIGIQLENEYSSHSPIGGAAHISTLKHMAIEAGLDVPLYTVTGWDNATYPRREVIPVFGGYPDEFWSGSRELPPDPEGVYLFHVAPTAAPSSILQGTTAKPEDEVQLWHYPKFTAELGGGMQVAYHRRPLIEQDDIAPMTLVQLGSGVNLLGYYMFHGGTNPEGKLTTLQESQATDYPSDLPVKSYDFQAPLREFGQMNGSFGKIKVIHQFLADFGGYLAPMTAVAPDIVPSDALDNTTPRVVARTDGDRGFVFFNNYRRNEPLPEQRRVQVVLKLPSETIRLPREPFDIPSQSSFFWSVNLDLGGATLKYATAQPFVKIANGKQAYYFFVAAEGIAAQFVFARLTTKSVDAKVGMVSRQGDRVYVDGLGPSTSVAITVLTRTDKTVNIVLLSQSQAEDAWKVSLQGHERMLMTSADVYTDGNSIQLHSRNPNAFSFSIFGEAAKPLTSTVSLVPSGYNGIFCSYAVSVQAKQSSVQLEKIRDATPSSPVKMGKVLEWRHGAVAIAPDDADFEKAAVWRLTLPKDALDGFSDIFLNIHYVGDVARLYQGTRLLDDNYFNRASWEIGLKRFAPEVLTEGMELRILPLRKDAPIFIPKTSWPEFGASVELSDVKAIKVLPEYEVRVNFPPEAAPR